MTDAILHTTPIVTDESMAAATEALREGAANVEAWRADYCRVVKPLEDRAAEFEARGDKEKAHRAALEADDAYNRIWDEHLRGPDAPLHLQLEFEKGCLRIDLNRNPQQPTVYFEIEGTLTEGELLDLARTWLRLRESAGLESLLGEAPRLCGCASRPASS